MLNIYAGKKALKTIQKQGFKQELFTSFLGASGGPKWFVLLGLDKFIFGEFFKDRNKPLNVIGSSAGAFRSACFAQDDPVGAIERLAKNYSETVYSQKPDATEITTKAKQLLDIMFAENGIDEVIHNPIFKAHFIVAKTQGLVSFEHKVLQGFGLVKSLILNRISRKLLHSQYQRYIFQAANSDFILVDNSNFTTIKKSLTYENTKAALLASGSIPMVMQGVKDIAGCDKGTYRDGGIIDYHFDFKIKNEGLTLYPHFSSSLKAGWFDKSLVRKVSASNYENTVLLCPSAKFIQSLPYQKIPDRTDFTHLDDQTRLKYWRTVFTQSEQLADEFSEFIKEQKTEKIQSIKTLLD
jgi:hypothetical protein